MITLRLDHVLNVGLSTLLLAGCGGQLGAPAAPTGLAAARPSAGRAASWPRSNASLRDEVLSGTYSGTCTHRDFDFVAEGRAIGPIKGTFLAYGTWKVGPNEWQFQEHFKIKSRRTTLGGSVVGTEAGGKSTCEEFRDKPLFYFAHHEEGRVRAVIGHQRFSRVFLEQFENRVRNGGSLTPA